MFSDEQIRMLEELARKCDELGESYINNETYSLEQTASDFVNYPRIPGVFDDVDEECQIAQQKKKNREKRKSSTSQDNLNSVKKKMKSSGSRGKDMRNLREKLGFSEDEAPIPDETFIANHHPD